MLNFTRVLSLLVIVLMAASPVRVWSGDGPSAVAAQHNPSGAIWPDPGPPPPPLPAPISGVQLVDPEPVADITSDGESLYVLRRSGELWRHRSGGWSLLASHRGLSRPTAHRGELFVQKYGDVWRHSPAGWELVGANMAPTFGLFVESGMLFVCRNRTSVFRFDGGRWWQVDPSTDEKRDICAGPGGTLYVLVKRGNLYRYRGQTRWDQLDNDPSNRAVFATRSALFVVKKDGSLWQHDAAGWRLVPDSSRCLGVLTDGEHVISRDPSGAVRVLSGSTWMTLHDGKGIDTAFLTSGQLFVTDLDGRAYRLAPPGSVFDLAHVARREIGTRADAGR